jgi:hypothetical protein
MCTVKLLSVHRSIMSLLLLTAGWLDACLILLCLVYVSLFKCYRRSPCLVDVIPLCLWYKLFCASSTVGQGNVVLFVR